ncbi:MAG: hypothetical protein IKZ90_01845 [Clostridiales bacterium]|nr:hypothetical protein [Clostridiales bacterium]
MGENWDGEGKAKNKLLITKTDALESVSRIRRRSSKTQAISMFPSPATSAR